MVELKRKVEDRRKYGRGERMNWRSQDRKVWTRQYTSRNRGRQKGRVGKGKKGVKSRKKRVLGKKKEGD